MNSLKDIAATNQSERAGTQEMGKVSLIAFKEFGLETRNDFLLFGLYCLNTQNIEYLCWILKDIGVCKKYVVKYHLRHLFPKTADD